MTESRKPRKKSFLFEYKPELKYHIVLVDENGRMIGMADGVKLKPEGTCQAERVYVLNPNKSQKSGFWQSTVNLFWGRREDGVYRVSKFPLKDSYVEKPLEYPTTTQLPSGFMEFDED